MVNLLTPMSKNDDNLVRIGEAARAAGVSTGTVEYYVMIGLLEPLARPGRHGRWFDARLIRRIKLIRKLNRLGYTLRDIKQTYLRKR